MFSEFKKFLLRGNVVDLAVAVVIGAAFGAVITALVADLITPLIAAVGGNPDFSTLSFTINGSKFAYGHFINAVISFVIIAAAIFFLVVKPINAIQARRRTGEEEEELSDEAVLLAEIRDELKSQGNGPRPAARA